MRQLLCTAPVQAFLETSATPSEQQYAHVDSHGLQQPQHQHRAVASCRSSHVSPAMHAPPSTAGGALLLLASSKPKHDMVTSYQLVAQLIEAQRLTAEAASHGRA